MLPSSLASSCGLSSTLPSKDSETVTKTRTGDELEGAK